MERVQENDLKIFIGPTELANIAPLLASALKERGISVTVGGMLDFQYLNTLQKIFKYLHYFLKSFLKHNAFIFLFGTSLIPYNLDLPMLKLLRKKTIVWFMGSDIRHYESLEAAARKAGIRYYKSKDQGAGTKALKTKLRAIHRVERCATYIISGPSYSQLLTREYMGKDMDSRIYIPIDVCNIRHDNILNPKMVVVHAPTHDKFKGTSYVTKAVEQLKREGYDFDFRLFRNMRNVEVRQALSEADIAVDQLFATGAGIFALEAMAAGCAVLGGNKPEFSGFPRELPVIHTDPDNICDNLKMLLENPELRQELGEKGRKYVEKYHDHRKTAADILRLLTEGKTGKD